MLKFKTFCSKAYGKTLAKIIDIKIAKPNCLLQDTVGNDVVTVSVELLQNGRHSRLGVQQV